MRIHSRIDWLSPVPQEQRSTRYRDRPAAPSRCFGTPVFIGLTLTGRPMTAYTLYDKVWEQHVVKTYDDGSALLYIDRHLVQEVSSPQAFAGLIDEGRRLRRPASACRRRRPCGSDAAAATCRRPTGWPAGRSRGSSRTASVSASTTSDMHGRSPRHRPRHRSGTRLHLAGCDARLRRQPHLDAWRLRRASPSASAPASANAYSRPRRCASASRRPCASSSTARCGRRRRRQGYHPRADRADRHQWRRRLRHRICGPGHRRPVDGSAHDALQHVDRGRQPRRHGRARRDDLRLCRRPPAGAAARRSGTRR